VRTVKRLAFKLDAQDVTQWTAAKAWASQRIRTRGYGYGRPVNDADTLRELLRLFVETVNPARQLEHGQTGRAKRPTTRRPRQVDLTEAIAHAKEAAR